jgi:hypothetical protein
VSLCLCSEHAGWIYLFSYFTLNDWSEHLVTASRNLGWSLYSVFYLPEHNASESPRALLWISPSTALNLPQVNLSLRGGLPAAADVNFQPPWVCTCPHWLVFYRCPLQSYVFFSCCCILLCVCIAEAAKSNPRCKGSASLSFLPTILLQFSKFNWLLKESKISEDLLLCIFCFDWFSGWLVVVGKYLAFVVYRSSFFNSRAVHHRKR